jgi:hypothetical protein
MLSDIFRHVGIKLCTVQNKVVLATEVNRLEYRNCGDIQTEPTHWLGRAYAETMDDSGAGITMRNQANAGVVLATMLLLEKWDGNLVDCLSGFQKMRDT